MAHVDKREEDEEPQEARALDEGDIAVLKSYVRVARAAWSGRRRAPSPSAQGQGPYTSSIKRIEKDIDDIQQRVVKLIGAGARGRPWRVGRARGEAAQSGSR